MSILFSQVREDPRIELFALSQINLESENINALCVTSGGCTVLSILDKVGHVDAVDMNLNQNYLCELKGAAISHAIEKYEKNNQLGWILKFYKGKLDYTSEQYCHLLDVLGISEPCRQYWKTHVKDVVAGINQIGAFEQLFRDLVNSNMDFGRHFSDLNLMRIFGKNAVENSSRNSFANHFAHIVETYKRKHSSARENYFYHQMMHDDYPNNTNNLPRYLKNTNMVDTNKHKISYITHNFVDYVKKCTDNCYHLIQTSNITDWMSSEHISDFLKNLHRILKPNGVAVLRRLNGDYCLGDHLIGQSFVDIGLTTDLTDSSHFYSEVIVLRKIDIT
jgi:S-adenosylmethionine:diacylglycerol 3-amino-3-carboxypropyl transferase